LHSISTPVSTPSYNASVNWSLTSGNTYWLLETSGTNSKFVAFGLPLPSNADIAITFSGTFDSTIAGAIANNGGFQSNEWWAAFNDITTSSSAVPLPAALPLFATGLAGLGLLFWRRKRKAQAVD
jgi:hypothetical protein